MAAAVNNVLCRIDIQNLDPSVRDARLEARPRRFFGGFAV
jgi:hypothetical protein